MKNKTIGIIFVLLILASTLMLTPTLNVKAATLFSDDYETNNYSKWQGNQTFGATLDISSTTVLSGQYSADCSMPGSVGSYAFVYKNTASPVIYHREYIRVSSLPPAGAETDLFGIMDQIATGFHLGTIAIQNDNSILKWKLQYYNNGAQEAAYSTAVAIKANTWYYVEIMVKPGAGNGQVAAWIAEDMTPAAEASPTINIPNLNIASAVGAVFFGGYIKGATYPVHIYSDNVLVSDTWNGPRDFTAPIIGAITATSISVGADTTLRSIVTDDSGIDSVIPSWNNTGTWVNQTAISAAGSKNFTASFNGKFNGTAQTVVSTIFYAKDIANNWAKSNQVNFTLNAYAATLTSNQSGPAAGNTIAFTLAVTKNGAPFNNYLANITKNGALFATNVTNNFTDKPSIAGTYTYAISSLYDNSTLQNVTLTTSPLSITLGSSYDVLLYTTQPSMTQGNTASININVTKNGLAFTNYLVNVTRDGVAFSTRNITTSFTDVESAASTHTYTVASLYDLTTNQSVPLTSNTLTLTWTQTAASPTPTNNPTSTPKPTTKPTVTLKPNATSTPTSSPTSTNSTKPTPTATPPSTEAIPQIVLIGIAIVVIIAVIAGILLFLRRRK